MTAPLDELLPAIVALTRDLFGARACSIMRHDAASHELVFEAVAGEGEGSLEGSRIPAGTGLAGWVLASEEPIAVADVRRDPRFARDVAEQTGFVPTRMIVYPLLAQERSLGVLSVLDHDAAERVGLAEMRVLGRIAAHAAAVLSIVLQAREATTPSLMPEATARLERAVAGADPERRRAVEELLGAMARLLERG